MAALPKETLFEPKKGISPTKLTLTPPSQALKGPEPMQANMWFGTKDVRVGDYPRVKITDPDDVIVRTVTTTVCGSDLHIYLNKIPGVRPIEKGDVLGHEAVGVIEEIGPNVRNRKVGDRVVVPFTITCGQCFYCLRQEFSLCETTNPSKQMEEMYGQRIAGLFGYTHLTGGYEGCQAQFIRVPFGEQNTLVLPEEVDDNVAILLSDVACTGWHGNELGNVKPGDTVCIWGCGPVGLMAAKWAKFRGASKVVSIDNVPDRLQKAQRISGVDHVINFDEVNVNEAIRHFIPDAPDVCIDCVGYRFPKTLTHKFQTLLRLETDALDIVNEMVLACRKGGHVVLIGDYFGWGNQFPIGAFMEKAIIMRGGQAWPQKYWRHLLELMKTGKVDLSPFITPILPFDRIPEIYARFNDHDPNIIKAALKFPLPERKTSLST